MKLKENRTQGDRGHEIELCQMKNIDKNVKETEWYNRVIENRAMQKDVKTNNDKK